MTKIAILDDWQDVARNSTDWSSVSALADLTFFADAIGSEDQLVRALADFEIILTMRERTAFPASLITRLPKLRMLGITGAANSTLDLQACTRQGIAVCNTDNQPPRAPNAPAELALGLLLAAARAIPAADAAMRAGGFQHGVPVGMSLAGKTLGIIGLGRLGALVARYASALEMNIVAWSPNLTDERAANAGARLAGKAELLATADAITLHMVLSPSSRGMIGSAEIARMKPGCILINTSRGPLIDEPALIEAVQSGRIIAALDVFDTEPLPSDHPLRRCRNTILTPHLGYGVEETWRSFYAQSAENAAAFLLGNPIRVINAVHQH